MADRPESAATQTKLPSRLSIDAAAPGDSTGRDVEDGTEPDAELVGTLVGLGDSVLVKGFDAVEVGSGDAAGALSDVTETGSVAG